MLSHGRSGRHANVSVCQCWSVGSLARPPCIADNSNKRDGRSDGRRFRQGGAGADGRTACAGPSAVDQHSCPGTRAAGTGACRPGHTAAGNNDHASNKVT